MKKLLISQNNSLLSGIIDSAPLPMGVYTGDNLIIELANQCMIDTWGKGGDVIGKSYTDVLPELKSQEIFDQARNVLKTGIPFHAKNQRVDIMIEGALKSHYFNYSFTPLLDSDGEIYGVMNTGADVTNLNNATLEKHEAEQRLNLALDSADLGTYETDLTTNRVVTSPRFDAIWDLKQPFTREDVISSLHPDDRNVREKAHNNALTNGGNLFYEARIIHKDKSIHWVRVKGKIIFNSKNEPLTLIGIVQDITEQKLFAEQLEQKVLQKTEELQRSNNDLVQFAHIVSHDLKEPVRKIKFFNNMLRAEQQKTIEESIIYIDKVDLAAKRMTVLIDGILDYSTLNATRYKIDEIDLAETIEHIVMDLELIIQEKQAILIKDDLPKIKGISILIHQLFYNLINNALKFSKSTEPPRVVISSKFVEINNVRHIEITVKDNGIGINPEYSEKIFDAFHRLHSKNQYEGNGLGLSLCRKIAERHHGTIKATGEENIGTEFVVTLPLEQQSSNL